MNIVSATKSNGTIVVIVNDDGKIRQETATSDHPQWTEINKIWESGNYDGLLSLLSLKRVVEKFSKGGLVVSDQGVFFKDIPLSGVDVNRLMAYVRENIAYDSIANYMVRKMANSSRRAIKEMYNFLEHRNMPLTPNGFIVAYKGVQKDFFSVSSGEEPLISGRRNGANQIFNGVGEVIHMDRSFVDDDYKSHCSNGLHAGSLQYAKDWARQHNGIIILIEIDPADVVSVPDDCNCSKLRCCKYKVIGVYDGPLPDTFTADYEVGVDPAVPGADTTAEQECCSECGFSPENCECGSEECDECGEEVSMCVCHGNQEEIVAKDPSKPMTLDNVQIVKKGVPVVPGETEEESKFRFRFITQVCEVLAIDPDKVYDTSKFIDDLGADSLDTVELVMAMEEEFNVDIPDEVAENCDTVGQAMAAIKNLLLAKKQDLNATYGQLGQPAPASNPEPEPQKVQEPPTPSTATKSFQEGYDLGFRNGVRKRKRLFYDDLEVADQADAEYARGYCEGYRAGRKDYRH